MAYHLSVDRGHVLQGLKLLRKPKTMRRRHDAAIVGFDGSFVTVEVAGVMFLARATGTWPGNAVVSDTLFQALAAAPPSGDPIMVTCDGEHLGFGPLKVVCKWQPISSVVLARPRQSEWVEAIALKYTLPRGRIFVAGRSSEVKAAEKKLAALIARVAKSLAPLGVTAADIETLVERRLEERYTACQGTRPT
jgi:hypothetical protein